MFRLILLVLILSSCTAPETVMVIEWKDVIFLYIVGFGLVVTAMYYIIYGVVKYVNKLTKIFKNKK